MENLLVECQVNINTGPNFDRDLYLSMLLGEAQGWDVEIVRIEPEVPGEFTVVFRSSKGCCGDVIAEISNLDPEIGTLDYFTELEIDNYYLDISDNNI